MFLKTNKIKCFLSKQLNKEKCAEVFYFRTNPRIRPVRDKDLNCTDGLKCVNSTSRIPTSNPPSACQTTVRPERLPTDLTSGKLFIFTNTDFLEILG